MWTVKYGKLSETVPHNVEADFMIQTVLLTGGSTGMGRGVAKILSQKGANIVIVARNQGRLADALAFVEVGDRQGQSFV